MIFNFVLKNMFRLTWENAGSQSQVFTVISFHKLKLNKINLKKVNNIWVALEW